ncbi:hypothetical protein [Mesorhizobium sp. M1396]|uniref:hypothetical protein n=1 Tax=Mesorhizobium sp. M1396 TaxID=2957095 RepID=UPI003336C964
MTRTASQSRHGEQEWSSLPRSGTLLHTLPDDFHRIRHYGFLADGNRAAKLDLCHGLLAGSQQNDLEPDAESAAVAA